MNNVNKKVAIVTGAYGAIGFSIAKELAFRDIEVVLVGRSERRLEEAVSTILALKKEANVWYELVDLSNQQSIKNLCRKWEGPLDILINNAGTTPREKIITREGLEVQFATNVMGYFWMTHYLSEVMEKSTEARIVNVASYWAGGLDMHDLQFENRNYCNEVAYKQSKQANRMLTVAFAELLYTDGITVNACHPGDVNSKLSNNLGYGGHETPESGATTPIWLAIDSSVLNISGKYFENKKLAACDFAENKVAIDELYRYCYQLLK